MPDPDDILNAKLDAMLAELDEAPEAEDDAHLTAHAPAAELTGAAPDVEWVPVPATNGPKLSDREKLRVQRAAHNLRLRAMADAAENTPRLADMLPREVIKPVKKAGRSPKLNSAEVEAIRKEQGRVKDIAARWGVSDETIRWVQRRGHRWRKYGDYVPSDQYVREEVVGGNRGGRRLAGRTTPLTMAEVQAIYRSEDTIHAMAEKYRVSYHTIIRIRRTYRDYLVGKMGLENAIRSEVRHPSDIARLYDEDVGIINYILAGGNMPTDPPPAGYGYGFMPNGTLKLFPLTSQGNGDEDERHSDASAEAVSGSISGYGGDAEGGDQASD